MNLTYFFCENARPPYISCKADYKFMKSCSPLFIRTGVGGGEVLFGVGASDAKKTLVSYFQ